MLVCPACPRSLELNRRLECRRALPRYRRGNRDCGIESRFSRIVHSRSRSNVLDSFRSMTRLIAGPENMKNNAPRGRNCLPILNLRQTALQGMSLHFLRLNFVKFTRKESEIGTCWRFTRPPPIHVCIPPPPGHASVPCRIVCNFEAARVNAEVEDDKHL